MSDRGKTTSQLPVWSNSVSGNDSIMLLTRSQSVPNTYMVNLSVAFANADFDMSLSNSHFLTVNNIVIVDTTTPANSASTTAPQGKLWSDGTYLYLATSLGHVKRMGPFTDF